ncbi:uncharacterized protein METZ01_LOCUS140765, partial [marine metagenome]
ASPAATSTVSWNRAMTTANSSSPPCCARSTGSTIPTAT